LDFLWGFIEASLRLFHKSPKELQEQSSPACMAQNKEEADSLEQKPARMDKTTPKARFRDRIPGSANQIVREDFCLPGLLQRLAC
jgi:hypothetical protein